MATSISVERLEQLTREGKVDLVDVRTPVEFREAHIAGACNIPLSLLSRERIEQIRPQAVPEDKPLVLVCRSGSRSLKAHEQLVKEGVRNVVHVDGGTEAWREGGRQVVEGKKAISLERQVRIAAGALVLLGAVLSIWIPAFALLSGFVGAGLIFAGITDTCGMALLLARMPWNQVGNGSASCSLAQPQENAAT